MFDSFEKIISQIPEVVINQLIGAVKDSVARCGIYFRIFGRVKTYGSFLGKTQKKKYNLAHKLQDLFGVRIAVYFKDDIAICEKIVRKNFFVDESNTHIEKEAATEFKPTLMNIVCRIPEHVKMCLPDELFSSIIDDTFEIQIRTVFSEGWHEVEHDLRYKCKEEWVDDLENSRALNGIYATLVTCDWSIIRLFDERAHDKYRKEEWISMLKNKFRIKFFGDSAIDQIFNKREFMKKYLNLIEIK